MKGNQIQTENGSSFIIIPHRDGSESRVEIDTEDIQKVVGLTWGLTCGYAATQLWSAGRGSTKIIYYLHRYLMDLPPYGLPSVDYKDKNRMNCRKGNLKLTLHNEKR